MPYLIDGHNLIPRVPGIHLHDVEDEIQLIDLLKDYCRNTRSRAEVYFDNAPPGSAGQKKFGRVISHFIRQGRTADDAIRLRLRKLGRASKNWTVVTSDREIIAGAREAGANWMSTIDFASLIASNRLSRGLQPDLDADLELSPEAIEEWLNIFGLDEEDSSGQ